ncbi:hypothetical protein ACLKA7_001697 [Drosophila subpalustris]
MVHALASPIVSEDVYEAEEEEELELAANQPRQSRPQNKGKYFLFASEQLHQALMGTSMCFAGERASGHNRNLDSGQWQTL